MKKGQVLEGTIEKVEFPNKGVVTVAEEGSLFSSGSITKTKKR